MRTGVLCALGSAGEAALVAAIDAPGSGMEVVRRCADLAEVTALAITGLGTVALLSGAGPDVDRAAVARLNDVGCAVVLLADPADIERCRGLGAALTISTAETVSAVVQAVQECARSSAMQARRERAPGGGVPDNGGVGAAGIGHVALPHGGGVGSRPRRLPAGGPGGPAGEPGAAEATPDQDESAAGGRVVAVWGPHGAPGRTTLAVNLAAELAAGGSDSLLVDADTWGGAVAQTLGLLDESPGLAAAVRAAANGLLDTSALERLAPFAEPGMRVLTGIPRPDRWRELTPAGLDGVFETSRRVAAWTVVDCGFSLEDDAGSGFEAMLGPRRNGATLKALAVADVVVAVGAGEPVGIQRLVQGLADLAELGIPSSSAKLLVVANRVRTTAAGPAPTQAVTEALVRYAGVADVLVVPDDRPALDRAMLAGATLRTAALQSPARTAIRMLADELAGRPAARRPGLLGMRRGRVSDATPGRASADGARAATRPDRRSTRDGTTKPDSAAPPEPTGESGGMPTERARESGGGMPTERRRDRRRRAA